MRVLIVEDDIRNVEELRHSLIGRFGADSMLFVLSRDSAIKALTEETFDLVVLDRKIPTSDNAFDPDIAHGDQVYQFLHDVIVGTPVRWWTALPDEDYWDGIVKNVSQEDIWGSGLVPTVGSISKSHPEKIEKIIADVQDSLASVEKIVLNQRPGNEVELTYLESRILKVLAKRLGGDSVEVVRISTGQSDAKVFRATVSSQGKPTHCTIGKLTSIHELPDELIRRRHFQRLNPGLTPDIVLQIRAGAGALGGTFYQLAGKHESSLFKKLESNPQTGSEIVQSLKGSLDGWFKASTLRTTTIKEIRQQLAPEKAFAAANIFLPHLDLVKFEEKKISWNESYCHGDLHGENILCDDAGPPIVIDFGDVGLSIAARDPVTLELCQLFHPNGGRSVNNWPSLDQAKNWHNLNLYLEGCPYPEFVRLCRNWAYDWGGGNPALYASAYAYLVRQFKYVDTEKALAAVLIESIVTAFRKL